MEKVKIRERKICINCFEPTSCDALLATFTLEFLGLLIPRCGVFYSRKGKIAFQLPYDAPCELYDEDLALVLKKLTAEIDKRKAKDPEYFDKVDECPF